MADNQVVAWKSLLEQRFQERIMLHPVCEGITDEAEMVMRPKTEFRGCCGLAPGAQGEKEKDRYGEGGNAKLASPAGSRKNHMHGIQPWKD
jgi:hypothetical protein